MAVCDFKVAVLKMIESGQNMLGM